jgi:LuxR family transcriptional regulator, maltose regulon positive regulatory protein
VPTALLETKLYVPRSRRGLVPRPRLSERLDRGAASTLMLVSAPAGFGKTTLLTEWLAAGPAAPGGDRRVATGGWRGCRSAGATTTPYPSGPT